MGNTKFNIRKVLLCVADAIIIAVGGVVANFLLQVFNFKTGFISVAETPYVVVSIIINVVVCIVALFLCGAYNKLWRYFRAKDYISCLAGMMSGVAISTMILALRYNVFRYVLPYTLISDI